MKMWLKSIERARWYCDLSNVGWALKLKPYSIHSRYVAVILHEWTGQKTASMWSRDMRCIAPPRLGNTEMKGCHADYFVTTARTWGGQQALKYSQFLQNSQGDWLLSASLNYHILPVSVSFCTPHRFISDRDVSRVLSYIEVSLKKDE